MRRSCSTAARASRGVRPASVRLARWASGGNRPRAESLQRFLSRDSNGAVVSPERPTESCAEIARPRHYCRGSEVVFRRQLPSFDAHRQNILLRRQRTSGIRRERAGWIVSLVEIQLDLAIPRQHGMEKPSGAIGLLACGPIAEDEKQICLALFDHR